MNPLVVCRSPLKTKGSFPWRGSSSHPIRFWFCGGCDGGLIGGGDPPGGDGGVSDCLGGVRALFRIGAVVVLNRFRVGKAQLSVLLTKGGDVMFTGCGV